LLLINPLINIVYSHSDRKFNLTLIDQYYQKKTVKLAILLDVWGYFLTIVKLSLITVKNFNNYLMNFYQVLLTLVKKRLTSP